MVTLPRHSGSSGVTLTMMPQRAYVDLPTQMTSTSRGILKTSTVSHSANEFGGTMMWSPPEVAVSTVTKQSSVKFLGSTMACRPVGDVGVKILKRVPTRTS